MSRRTTIEIEVLLHYFYSGEAYSPDSESAREARKRLILLELLEAGGPAGFQCTPKGLFHVEAILCLPLPVTMFYTPGLTLEKGK